MGLITTQHLGFGQNKPDPTHDANPKPVVHIDYAGQPIKPGGFYDGRPEHMNPNTAKPAAKHYELIGESDVGEVFGFGSYTLTKAEAAQRLAKLTGGHRVSCYRALRRFGQHLHSDGEKLSWR